MGDRDKRTLKMKEEYVSLFNEGLTPKQIADKFGLSSWTVYHHLGEIAERAGVPRDSLLKRSCDSANDHGSLPRPISLAGVSEFRQYHQEVMESAAKMHNYIIKHLAAQKEMLERVQKEEAAW
ncbi:MAG: helix-turn-helix transcriptional regulator [Candidatus Saccharibacteria bacterium]|nr:helix-turn-helix transcriptional regulator [Candidatus Saccharibacteria bacterium]